MQRVGYIAALSFFFLVLGYIQPSAVLLDVPFAFGYYLLDANGLWSPSPLWVKEHNLLCSFSAFGWPFFVSTLYGYMTVYIASRIRQDGTKYAPLLATIFVIAVFGLILSIRVQPGTAPISFYSYWTTNY